MSAKNDYIAKDYKSSEIISDLFHNLTSGDDMYLSQGDWELLRELTLRHPTCSRETLDKYGSFLEPHYINRNIDNKGQKNLLFKLDKNATGLKMLVQILLSDEEYINGYSRVNELSSRLLYITRNQLVLDGFCKRGYATAFNQDYIMLPSLYTRVYKGAIGEKVFEIVCQEHGIQFTQLYGTSFEFFDYLLCGSSKRICVDMKNYHKANYGATKMTSYLTTDEKNKISAKMKKAKADTLVIIGLGNQEAAQPAVEKYMENVYCIDGLLYGQGAMLNTKAVDFLTQLAS